LIETGPSPKKKAAVAEPPYDSEHSGLLSRKKLNHGRFEDPYKTKVLCWIKQGKLFILPLSSDRTPLGTDPEEINIASSQVLPPFF
jgi:hypothetical protein